MPNLRKQEGRKFVLKMAIHKKAPVDVLGGFLIQADSLVGR